MPFCIADQSQQKMPGAYLLFFLLLCLRAGTHQHAPQTESQAVAMFRGSSRRGHQVVCVLDGRGTCLDLGRASAWTPF